MEQSAHSPGSSARAEPELGDRLRSALEKATATLLRERTAEGHWTGELSSSPLSTATAVIALAMVDRAEGTQRFGQPIREGLKWLEQNVNEDGGWGDTGSLAARAHPAGGTQETTLSNISTTALGWAAYGAVAGADAEYRAVVGKAVKWLENKVRALNPGTPAILDIAANPEPLVRAIVARYGKDRTFSVPILTACALAGRLGAGKIAWRWVIPLPFELAVFPPSTFAALRLPVVSYALPALIAIGLARHVHAPSRNPLARLARNLSRGRALRVLRNIQPSSGGFLEATPLTSFVVMSLAGSGEASNGVTKAGVDFLRASQRPDGSWPIDTNLATWVTTLAIDALGHTNRVGPLECTNPVDWLLKQQYRVLHPYTQAAPGGWAWTDLPGGVPDADDTAGAVVALATCVKQSDGRRADEIKEAAIAGMQWLMGLQNRDGGIPTFCRGWGNLPFDRSSCDITAHAVRAWVAWREAISMQDDVRSAIKKAIAFLEKNQRSDGAWAPLWFGNQFAASEENLTYGTARVLTALEAVAKNESAGLRLPAGLRERGLDWLINNQNADGGWGGERGLRSSVEETALAVEALAINGEASGPRGRDAMQQGTRWLLDAVDSGEWNRATPIGFYFAKLWYYERLYPKIFTVAALRRALQRMKEEPV